MYSQRYSSSSSDPSPLAQPLHFEHADRSASNRFLKGATTEHLASWHPNDPAQSGIPTPGLVNVYRRWGEGGFGQIVTGNIMIDPTHLEERGNMIIPGDADFRGERFDAFRQLGAAGRAQGSLMVGQISHPGRLAHSRLQHDPVSASSVPVRGNLEIFKSKELLDAIFTYAPPHAASLDEVATIIDGFAHAAEFLDRAGWDGIQLQAAHGFLLSQFLSSVSNQREDNYGGSLENRIRLIIEIAAEIRKRVSPNFILGIKINSVDFQSGFSAEDAQTLCKSLETAHFDYVELSGGSVETNYAEVSGSVDGKRESTKARESFFLNFADQIVAPLSSVKAYVTGGFKTVGGMVDALRSVDGVGLVRAACQEPCLPREILAGNVTGAINRLLDDHHWGVTTVAAGAQIRQLSKDLEPFDQSIQANADSFLADFDIFLASFGKEADENNYGFMDLSQPAQPYGVQITAP
ncbi:hypothetical protein BDV96DRAFT_533879 [Lophiotrema nucula]|uniref:NADH:flavin oxidoreductase/NADH oxidase N-terminal domain-containing protein n=1 Tax=Lophiotrema nucula TaxID=690887 RepID=A0A6A5YHB1_9PLEO|nr:hypothetical protein BDV96DRAFT_533879 [Lophiotrema nucula]